MSENSAEDVKTLGAAISREQSQHWTIDKRVPVFSVVALIGAGLITASGWLFIAGGMNRTFADEVIKVEAHEIRITAVEAGLVKANLDNADMRGDIKEILALLHQQADWRDSHERSPR